MKKLLLSFLLLAGVAWASDGDPYNWRTIQGDASGVHVFIDVLGTAHLGEALAFTRPNGVLGPMDFLEQTEWDAEEATLVAALATKAPLISPALLGTPTTPTATPTNNTTQIASTAFVQAAGALLVAGEATARVQADSLKADVVHTHTTGELTDMTDTGRAAAQAADAEALKQLIGDTISPFTVPQTFSSGSDSDQTLSLSRETSGYMLQINGPGETELWGFRSDGVLEYFDGAEVNPPTADGSMMTSGNIGVSLQAWDADLDNLAGNNGANLTGIPASSITGSFNHITMLGTLTRTASQVVTPQAMSGFANPLEIRTGVALQTKTATAAHTFTFDAAPPTGTEFGLDLTGDSVERDIIIPSCRSFDRDGATITSFKLPVAPFVASLWWKKTASGYDLYGDPGTSSGRISVANGKVLTASNTITLTGTDGTTITTPTTNATMARTDAAQTFTGTQTFGAIVGTTLNGQAIEHAVSFSIGNSGAALTTGVQAVIANSAYSGTLTRWTMTVSPADTITCDILRSADGGAAPSTSIVGGSGTKPNVASGVNSHSTTFTSWTSTAVTAYDNFKCQVTFVGGTATQATVTLYFQ